MPVPTANYTGTHNWASQAIDNYQLGQHGTGAPATNPEFRRGGGVVGTAPGTYADNIDVVSWVDRRGFSNPHLDLLTLFSTTTAGTQTTSTGTWLTGLGGLNHLMVLVDITGTGGTDPTLDAFLDTDFGGTRVINVARSTLMVGPQAAMIILDKAPGTGGQIGSVNADAAAGAVRSIGFGDRVRFRYTVGSNATSQVSVSVYISGVA